MLDTITKHISTNFRIFWDKIRKMCVSSIILKCETVFFLNVIPGVFINIVFFRKFENVFRTLASLGVYTGLQDLPTKLQVEHQRCSRTGRAMKNHNILRKEKKKETRSRPRKLSKNKVFRLKVFYFQPQYSFCHLSIRPN